MQAGTGPCIIVSRNRGRAYIVVELYGAKISLPPLDSLIDISLARLGQMEASEAQDPEDEDDDEIREVPPMDDD